jgi:hypothetical protein
VGVGVDRTNVGRVVTRPLKSIYAGAGAGGGGRDLACESRAGQGPAIMQVESLRRCVGARDDGVGGEQSEPFLIYPDRLSSLV